MPLQYNINNRMDLSPLMGLNHHLFLPSLFILLHQNLYHFLIKKSPIRLTNIVHINPNFTQLFTLLNLYPSHQNLNHILKNQKSFLVRKP